MYNYERSHVHVMEFMSKIQNLSYSSHMNKFDVENTLFKFRWDKIDKLRGMDIIFVTTAETDEEARELLTLLGMPFRV